MPSMLTCGGFGSMRLVAVFLSVAILACLTSEPSTSPMDIRAAPGDTGTMSGQVGLAVGPGPFSRGPVPGAIVELGRWRGNAVDLHDVVTRLSPDQSRFHVILRTVSDDSGSFRFTGLPLHTVFALRARPPAGTPYAVTYLDSLFTVAYLRRARILFRANPSR
jgi:hypothetical protein